MRWTQEQYQAWLARNPGASISSIPEGSSTSAKPSLEASPTSSPCKSKGKTLVEVFAQEEEELRWGKGMNKTEREYLNLFLLRGSNLWRNVERETLKLRVGPPDQRCTYTPDFTAVNLVSNRLTLIEVKGPFEREDARVKRMAAAKWCSERGISFLLAKRDKLKFWRETWLA